MQEKSVYRLHRNGLYTDREGYRRKTMSIQKTHYDYNNMMKKNTNIYRSLAVRFGLSECAFWILYVLRSNFAALTQRDLCDWLCQPKQSVNTGMKKLMGEELIELCYADDKRSKYLSLTSKGVDFCERTIDAVIEAEKKALTGLDDSEIQVMTRVFGKYTDLLEERFSLIGIEIE